MRAHDPCSLSVQLVVTSFAAFTLLGCGGDDPSTPGPTSSSSGSSGGASSSGASGSSGTSGSSGSSSGTSGGAMVFDGVPAGDPAAMNAWLQKKEYQAWPKDSAPRPFEPGAGGHSGSVRTYLSPTLDASMKGSGAEHPKGVAAVKEFLSGDQLTGWAAMVKTEDASDGGKGWYWYEVFDVSPGASAIGGQGSSTCTGCHSTGRDFVRTPYPLK